MLFSSHRLLANCCCCCWLKQVILNCINAYGRRKRVVRPLLVDGCFEVQYHFNGGKSQNNGNFLMHTVHVYIHMYMYVYIEVYIHVHGYSQFAYILL